MVVALLEDISKGLDDSSNMPTQEAHAEMEDAKVLSYSYSLCLYDANGACLLFVVCLFTMISVHLLQISDYIAV